MSDTRFTSPEAASFWHYISSSLGRLVQLAETIAPDGLHWSPPASSTNSIAVLAVHTLGNAEENILQTLCGQTMGRSRAGEFVERLSTADELLERWQDLRPRLESALAQLSAFDMDNERLHPRRGAIPGREVLIVVARHAAEHLGQAELTRDLWNATR
ncbi:MAG: DinB family protein [Thermomicrobiales bacterium]